MSKLLVAGVKGIIPIYKEPGISSFTVAKWIRLHIAYELQNGKNWYRPRVECFRGLEPFASGVITFGIGGPAYYIKYLQFCDCHYDLELRMGQTTETDYFKSPVIGSKPFDHIKLDILKDACQSFIGTQVQVMPLISFVPFNEEDAMDKEKDNDDNGGNISDNVNDTILERFDNEMHHKARNSIHSREVTCHSIDITNFNPPDIFLRVQCGSTFVIRSFVRDLFKKLNTHGCISKMERTREGPFTIDNCIDQTDLYLKYLKPALRRNSQPFINHMRQHLDKTPFYGNKRLGGARDVSVSYYK